MPLNNPDFDNPEGVTAEKRVQSLSANCPLPIGIIEAKGSKRLRLILKHDSINRKFIPVAEVSLGTDAMNNERWEITEETEDLMSFLSATAIYALHAHTVPEPAKNLIGAGNTLVEFVAMSLNSEESLIEDAKFRDQLMVLLNQYRHHYSLLKTFQSQQIIQ